MVWRKDAPIIYCRRVKRGRNECFTFYCEFCRMRHKHGAENGHRIAHCHNANSPYKNTGYNLVEVTKGGVVGIIRDNGKDREEYFNKLWERYYKKHKDECRIKQYVQV